ncbi:MAG: SDR family oxidoreductase [Spirochaetaceae bacterium]|nr:MAG: SDR family oxidoreductase [Spirochaetaceae bacterium]
MFAIAGKTVAVTGAGGALCGRMSVALASLGARIAVLDRDYDAAVRTAENSRNAAAASGLGGDAAAFVCDVLDEESLIQAREAVTTQFGPVDALVNGAGGNHPKASTQNSFLDRQAYTAGTDRGLFDVEFDDFRKTFDPNFFGTFLPTQVFAGAMVERGSGAVVNISSMTAIRPLTKVGAYGAAKAAVSNFTAWLAVHLAQTGVRVNAIAPGFFMTEQLRFLHVDQQTGELTARAEATIAGTPMGRYGYPDDLLGTLVWLISDASRFVTGTVIPVDGGFSVYSL